MRARPCAPAAYWFWDEIPDRARARAQAAQIVGAGFGMVMIQARLSLAREDYLSPAWLRGYRDAVVAAGEAGLEVGIYDEYNWISGHGGGRTVAGADDLRERHLFCATAAPGERAATVSEIASPWIDGLGPAGARWIYEDGVRRWDRWELIAALAHPHGGAEVADVGAGAVLRGGVSGATVTLADDARVPEGWAVTFFLAGRCASSRIPNHLDPRVAARFLDVVHRPYLKALDGLIGDPVTCFSFDHPYGGFYRWRERPTALGSSLLWDPALPHDPATLVSLLGDGTAGGAAARCAFYAAYAARMTESFLEPLRAFCDAHGLGLTGHELLGHVGGFELDGPLAAELDVRASFGADPFTVDRARTDTLVDASNFDAQLSPVMGDSVARAHGRSRCTVEQYAARRDPPQDFAAGCWELSAPRLRMAALRLTLLGARRFLLHALTLSDGHPYDGELLSNPRFDFPPGVNHEPWWGHVAAINAEIEAVSQFIEEGEPVRETAVVYPLHTLWARGPRDVHGALFGAWTQLLCAGGVGFDVVDDRDLDRAVVRDGRLWIGGRGYGSVVLPGVSVVVSPATVTALARLRDAGGTVLASAPAPSLDARGRIVSWPLEVLDGVPGAVSATLRAAGDPLGVTVDPGAGTVWRWVGHDRVVLLCDGPERRTARVGGHRVELDPHEVMCLRWPLVADRILPRLDVVATLDGDWTFTPEADVAPVRIDPARGWERQGFPELSGVGAYRRVVRVPAAASALELPVVHCAAVASLDGEPLGARGRPPYRFALPARVRGDGEAHELVIEVASSAANRLHAGTPWAGDPQPSGLGATPRLVSEAAGAVTESGRA